MLRKPTPPLTRADLDQVRCGNPACDELGGCIVSLGGACHPGGPVDVTYTAGATALVLACRCGKVVGAVAIGAVLDMNAVRCHPRRGCDVVYDHGVLLVQCAACDRTLAEIEVAP